MNPFAANPHELKAEAHTRRTHAVTLGLTVLLALAVGAIFTALVVRAAPALSLEMLWANPLDKGTPAMENDPIMAATAVTGISRINPPSLFKS